MSQRAQLSRTLKPHWVWAIALGSAIGWGAFVLPTDWMSTAGPVGAMLGLAIGGVLMLIIAVSYGFMIRNFPVSGGEFAYTYLRFGRHQAFVCAWFLALGYICIVALNASAFGLLGRFVLSGVVEQGFMYSIAGWEVYLGEVLTVSLVLVIFAWMNIRGAALSGRTQFVFCVVMLIGVALIASSAGLHPATSLGNIQPLFHPQTPSWTAVLAIAAIAPWAYVGFDNVPQAAEEFNFPPRKAFVLIIFAILAAIALYAVMIFATAVSTPWQQLVAATPLWGTGKAVSGLFGALGTAVLTVALCMGIFTGLSGFYIAASRLLFALGRAGTLPAIFAKLHPKYNTPYVGILFTCFFCLLAPWFGREVLQWIVDMSSVGVAIAYFYTCFAAFKLFRWSAADADEVDPVGTVSPVRKTLSLLGALSGLTFLGLLLIPGAPAFLGTPSWIALGIWTLLGVIFYAYRIRAYKEIPAEQLDYQILGRKSQAFEVKPKTGSEVGTT